MKSIHDEVAERLIAAKHQKDTEEETERFMRLHSKAVRASIGALVPKEETIQTLEPGYPFDSAIVGVALDDGTLRVIYDFHTALQMYQQVMKIKTFEEVARGFDQLLKGMKEAQQVRGGKNNMPLFVTPIDHVIGMHAMAVQNQRDQRDKE